MENLDRALILNVSNHPKAKWSDEQIHVAEENFGGIVDMPFPNVPPEMSSSDLDVLVKEYEQKIVATGLKHIHIAGEMTFLFRIINRLKRHNLHCFTSTTERHVRQEGDHKIATFKFVQFRDY